MVARHGDYWMGNLMVEGRQLSGVVDWELSRLRDIPFTDAYKFPTSYGFYLDRARGTGSAVAGHPGWTGAKDRFERHGSWRNLTGFGYAYFGRGWFPLEVRRFVRGRLTALQMGPHLDAIFFPLFLAEQAMILSDPVFRNGYRTSILALWRERNETWLWQQPAGGRADERRYEDDVVDDKTDGDRRGGLDGGPTRISLSDADAISGRGASPQAVRR